MIRVLDSLTRRLVVLTLVACATATFASAAPMKGKAATSYARPTPSMALTQPMPIEKGKGEPTTEESKPIDVDGSDVASTCDTMSQSRSHGRSGGFSSYTASGWNLLIAMLPGGGFSISWMEWTSASGDWWENENDSFSSGCNNGYGRG